ncbi:transmembrane protein 272-like [Chelmon rostratus]|uniref:transmembrane protein 272-like n=1 Tax=Chelmon rostratus TaxID=109905 RepID=UPI001BEC7E17|nr:transmembrane protein 272-like [Chelmon rostratus]
MSVWLLRHARKLPQPPTPILVISKVVLCAMPVAEIAIGATYLHDCPRQRHIPIYLIVLGVFSLVLVMLSCLPCTHEPEDAPPSRLSRSIMGWNSLISVFLFCWFIAGNVWTYSIYQPNYDKNTTNVNPYCNRTLYLFSFWTMTVVYILMGISLVVGCIYLVFAHVTGRTGSSDNV